MSGRGSREVHGRLPCDTPRILGGSYHSPTALSEGDLDHRHAVCGLRLGDFVRCPGLHTTDMQQAIVSVFMIDGEQPPGRVLRSQRQGEELEAIVLHASLLGLFRGRYWHPP